MQATKDLTLQEARAEAIRLWGPGGTAEFHAPRTQRSTRGRLARYPCVVGNGGSGGVRSVEGQGETWVEAFADVRPVAGRLIRKRKRPGSDPGP